jgi:hypothetical protein
VRAHCRSRRCTLAVQRVRGRHDTRRRGLRRALLPGHQHGRERLGRALQVFLVRAADGGDGGRGAGVRVRALRVRRAPRGVPEGTKGVARGAERAQPAYSGENALVRLLQARPCRARAFRTICKATTAEQPPVRRHRALVSAATPRRQHLAPEHRTAACARLTSAVSEISVDRNGRGRALTRSLSTSAPAARVSVH